MLTIRITASSGTWDSSQLPAPQTSSSVLYNVTTSDVQASAVLINVLIYDIFKILGQYQKKHTKIEE